MKKLLLSACLVTGSALGSSTLPPNMELAKAVGLGSCEVITLKEITIPRNAEEVYMVENVWKFFLRLDAVKNEVRKLKAGSRIKIVGPFENGSYDYTNTPVGIPLKHDIFEHIVRGGEDYVSTLGSIPIGAFSQITKGVAKIECRGDKSPALSNLQEQARQLQQTAKEAIQATQEYQLAKKRADQAARNRIEANDRVIEKRELQISEYEQKINESEQAHEKFKQAISKMEEVANDLPESEKQNLEKYKQQYKHFMEQLKVNKQELQELKRGLQKLKHENEILKAELKARV